MKKTMVLLLFFVIVFCCGFSVSKRYRGIRETVDTVYYVNDDGTLAAVWSRSSSAPIEPNEIITNDFSRACILIDVLTEEEYKHLIEHVRLALNSAKYAEAAECIETLPREMKSLYWLLKKDFTERE